MSENEIEGATVRLTEPVAGRYADMNGTEYVVMPQGSVCQVVASDDVPGTFLLTATTELREMEVEVELWNVTPVQFEVDR